MRRRLALAAVMLIAGGANAHLEMGSPASEGVRGKACKPDSVIELSGPASKRRVSGHGSMVKVLSEFRYVSLLDLVPAIPKSRGQEEITAPSPKSSVESGPFVLPRRKRHEVRDGRAFVASV